MKILTIMHPQYGDVCIKEGEVCQTGIFSGLTIDQAFDKVIKEGYGHKKTPAIFLAEMKDGSSEVFKAKDAKKILEIPDVNEVFVTVPFMGGCRG